MNWPTCISCDTLTNSWRLQNCWNLSPNYEIGWQLIFKVISDTYVRPTLELVFKWKEVSLTRCVECRLSSAANNYSNCQDISNLLGHPMICFVFTMPHTGTFPNSLQFTKTAFWLNLTINLELEWQGWKTLIKY